MDFEKIEISLSSVTFNNSKKDFLVDVVSLNSANEPVATTTININLEEVENLPKDKLKALLIIRARTAFEDASKFAQRMNKAKEKLLSI